MSSATDNKVVVIKKYDVQQTLLSYLLNDEILMTCGIFMKHANIKDNQDGILVLLEEISLQLIVEIYCTPKQNFCPIYFKKEMSGLGLSALVGHKIFSVMESWRRIKPEWVK